MAETVLELRRVSKAYGDRVVIRDVDLAVPGGATVAITGRSGSGKSTLFRLVAALERPTAGKVLVEGTDLATLDDAALSRMRLRRLGIVFQSLNLLPDLTALQNVRLPLDIAGVPRAEADERARRL
ncbi:MAG TPA: ATP-binding cassette domain-containing protein, partial [Candidatus Thermoplasmatota archaeon]|nr:ATP-binding cassette domain-containing protein [Candidatus Thermoplasmatota archaeon]